MTTSAPTLEMVAAEAGVSRSTASRVINGSPHVTPEAIAAVERAVERLNYVPFRAARVLAQRRTQSVALVVPERTARFFADPYLAAVVEGAATRLADTEYVLTLVISTESDPEKTRRYLHAGTVDGALILSHHKGDRSYASLAQTMPVVFNGRPMGSESETPYVVDVDNVAVARQATQILIDNGRTRIAAIGGPSTMAVGVDRWSGWRDALAAAGFREAGAERGDFSPASGASAMRRLLEAGVEIDGLFAASAQMAHGALEVMREHGLKVPVDVGVVAVDDDYFAQSAHPPLTTIRQPAHEVGTTMAEVLMALIDGRDAPRTTVLPTQVVTRGSE